MFHISSLIVLFSDGKVNIFGDKDQISSGEYKRKGKRGVWVEAQNVFILQNSHY